VETIDVSLAQVSGTPASLTDVASLMQSDMMQFLRMDSKSMTKHNHERARVIRDHQVGRHCFVDGVTPWGQDASHRSIVVLRSWVSEPGDTIDARNRAKEALRKKTADERSGPAKESTEEADYFKVCLADLPVAGDNYASGPSRWSEKWRGEFQFLMAYSQTPDTSDLQASSSGSDGVPGPVSMLHIQADPVYDELQPDITAWRALRKSLGDDIQLQMFRSSIIAHFDCRRQTSNPQVGSEAMGKSSSSSSSSSSFCTLPAPSAKAGETRSIQGNTQVFFVDGDALMRAGAFKITPSLPHFAVQTSAGQNLCPNSFVVGVAPYLFASDVIDEVGSNSEERATKHPRSSSSLLTQSGKSGLVWIPESLVARHVPAELRRILSDRANINAKQGTDEAGRGLGRDRSKGDAMASTSAAAPPKEEDADFPSGLATKYALDKNA